jgi:hypothetical protein
MSAIAQPVPRSRLYTRTLELLRNRPRTQTLRVISDDTSLPEGWLVSILCKPCLSPSVDRIEVLYEYLSSKRLQVG